MPLIFDWPIPNPHLELKVSLVLHNSLPSLLLSLKVLLGEIFFSFHHIKITLVALNLLVLMVRPVLVEWQHPLTWKRAWKLTQARLLFSLDFIAVFHKCFWICYLFFVSLHSPEIVVLTNLPSFILVQRGSGGSDLHIIFSFSVPSFRFSYTISFILCLICHKIYKSFIINTLIKLEIERKCLN